MGFRMAQSLQVVTCLAGTSFASLRPSFSKSGFERVRAEKAVLA